VLGDLDGQDLREPDQGRLAGYVGTQVGDSLSAGPAGDVHDPAPAAGDHAGKNRPGAEHRTPEIDFQAPPPFGRVGLPGRADRTRQPGVIDQQVHRPERSLNFADRPIHVARLGDIGRNGDRPASSSVDLPDDFLDLRFGLGDDGHGGTRTGQPEGNGPADAPAAARDDGDSISEVGAAVAGHLDSSEASEAAG
jgi:hypothetical protein